MNEDFLEPKSFGGNVKVELDLSNLQQKKILKMRQVLMHQNLLKMLI